MRKLKYSLLIVFVFATVASFTSGTSLAVDVLGPVCDSGITSSGNIDQSTVCRSDASSSTNNPLVGPDGIITRITQIFALVIGVFAVFAIIISGLRLILSAGDSNAVTKSRNAILYAVVGLLVVVFAQIIVSFVLSRL